jgi:eukaryotic-like serine/threonine-protein kinase
MSAPDNRRIEDLFEQLVDEPPSRQQARLESVREHDPQLASAVAALLKAEVDRHPVLEQDIATLAGGLLDVDGASRMPPRIGAYVLERHLGEGGMGSVYLARRDGLGDLVALKLLRDPWSSPAQRRRFASEQLLLAALNHRYIARLYDAGVTGDTPWFAMEYVSGPSLVEYCRQRGATLRERLALLRAACEAVSYAHRNLTVHLDLKPSNMLVNAEGDVKLVDFGVARHLSADGAADKTSTLNRWLSLNYAAPEQIRGESVDVQADVYSLGVILYELLVGVRPADLTRLSAAELAQRLQEEPPLPSTSVRNQPGAVHASKAEWRDLDALCSTAMRRDKATRYPTVDALIADVDHFLGDEPLVAQRTRASAYRLRKFLRRHRRPLAASAAAALLMAVLIASFTVQLIDARNTAVSSEARMQRIHQLMLNLFEGDDQAAGPAEGLRVVTLLDRGVREAESLDRDPDLQAELRHTFGMLYLKLGHVAQAEPLLTSAWTARQAIFGADHELTIRAQQGLAELRIEQSRMDEAEQLARSSLETAQRRFADASREVAVARAVAGKVLAANGDYEAALGLLEPAVTVLSQGPATVELSEALGDLANTHYYLGHVNESEQVNRRALPLDQDLFGDRHPYVAVTLYNLGNIRLDYGDYAEGERLFARAVEINESWYGATHPKTASSVLMLGRSMAYQGRLSDADALYRRALEALRAAYGDNHMRVGSVLSLMGDLARDQGQFAEAERLFQRAAAVFKTVTGADHEFYVHQRSNLGSVRLAQHQYAEAERELRPAVDQLSAQLPEHRYTALAQIRLGAALSHLERYEEAERHAAAGYRTLRRLPGSSAGELQDAARLLEEIYQALGRPDKAREIAADAGR